MPSPSDHELWQREQKFLARERERAPELFVPAEKSPDELSQRIGILSFPTKLPKGYIKYSPLDFIVEEIRLDEKVIAVEKNDPNPLPPSGCDGQGTVYVDLIKVGISTLDASTRIASALHLDAKQIAHAGIKDAVALTGQTLSIRGSTLEAVRTLELPNMILKHVIEGKGAVSVGGLKGNRFTLFIRTPEEPNLQGVNDSVGIINVKGVLNYYGPQRFGAPRFTDHIMGMRILRGEFEEAVRIYLYKQSPFEFPYFSQIRGRLEKTFGNWSAMREEIKNVPHSFRFEKLAIDTLEASAGPDRFAKALEAISIRTDLAVRTYASYLTNLVLSETETKGRKLPETIPLLLSQDPESQTFYAPWLSAHGTEGWLERLNRAGFLKFIKFGRNPNIQVRIWPKIHAVRALPEGVVISFDLVKGAYATTVLMYLFDVMTGAPVPAWVKTSEVDTKRVLETGSLMEVKTKLAAHLREMKGDAEASD
jgi:tRNA pseudouridine13 synthase